MNVSELRPPCGFEDRLEAELVEVVTARAARPRHLKQRAAAAMRRPAARAGVLAVGTAVAAAAGFAFGPSLSHRPAAPQTAPSSAGGLVHALVERARGDERGDAERDAGRHQQRAQPALPQIAKPKRAIQGQHESASHQVCLSWQQVFNLLIESAS